MKINIRIAGIPMEINTVYRSLTPSFHDYETDDPPFFTIEMTEEDVIEERKKSIAEYKCEGIVYPDFSPAELENIAIYRKIAMKLPDYDALVFHGSAVAVGEEAYLFTAKSGTGKTTHTNLWLKNIDGSYIVNGDKPILRLIDGKVLVCGTPWMGKERLGCPKNVPLKALCFLNRGTENRIEKTSFSQIMPQLIGQSYRPPNRALLIKTLKLLETIGQNVGLYQLFCNMEDEAATTAYKGMCL